MNRRSATTTKIFVGSLPPGVTADDLRSLFQQYGGIAECDVVNRCGFLHMEDRELAFKAIEDLNNTNFMGGRISVEKGRQKPPPRDRERNGYGGGRGGPRANNYAGGPMRGGRDNRVGPYMRDGGGDYERRPPQMMRNGGGYGGYDRPAAPERGYGDMYAGAPSRAPVYDARREGYAEEARGFAGNEMYDDGSYYDERPMGNGGGMDQRGPMMSDRRPPAAGFDDRRPPGGGYVDRRPAAGGYEERHPPAGGYDDRRPPMEDRRPLLNHGNDMSGRGGMGAPMPMPPSFDRRPQPDMYSRRVGIAKQMGGGYADNSYDNAFPPLQQQRFAGVAGPPRRDVPPSRRF